MINAIPGLVSFMVKGGELIIELIPDPPATTKFVVRCSAEIVSATLAYEHAKCAGMMIAEPRDE